MTARGSLDGERAAARAVVLLRYTLIAATGYLLVVEESFRVPPLGAILPLVLALASNLMLGRVPAAKLQSPYFGTALIVGDTAWITVALVTTGRFTGDFFYLYFFVLLLAALGESLELIALGAVAVCGAYLYLLTSTGDWSMWSSPSIIRVPFLATAAFFYGFLVDRTKHERRRANARTSELRDEVQVSSALVRVGREMISSLDQPLIVDRLCQVTAEVLECEASHTLLWKPQEEVFVPLASHGEAPEREQVLSVLRIAPDALADVLELLESSDVVEKASPAWALEAVGLPPEQTTLWMALRRRGELFGIHTATRRRPDAGFSPIHHRIAHGIAQTASMALANAHLFAELEKANRVKSDFVATMSHELRTPLNQIIGYTDLMLERTFGELNDEQLDVLRRVLRSSSDLLGLIQATLDLSRLEASDVEIQLETVHPADLLKDLDAETRHLQANPRVGFEWRAAPDTPPMRTDPLKLKMVLKNLVANAAKFTDAGSVVVRVESSPNGVEFSVADTGSGIAREDQHTIFEPFRQARTNGSEPHRGGVGLGLHIVRRLVDVLGGTVEVDSEVGRGSTFRIRLDRRDEGAAESVGASDAMVTSPGQGRSVNQ